MLLIEFRINIHGFMQNSDYFNYPFRILLVENKVTALREFPVSSSDKIACHPKFRIPGKPGKTMIQFFKVAISLRYSPFLYSKSSNFNQV